MPTGPFGFPRLWRLIRTATKHQRQSTLRHEGRRWRVLDREWCRREKLWLVKILPI
jgi:hypothetical protein